MKAIFNTLMILGLFIVSCSSQPKHDQKIVQEILKKLPRINFSKLVFFGPELVSVCKDTAVRSMLSKSLIQSQKIKPKTLLDKKEFDLTMFSFYWAISNTTVTDTESKVSRDNILKLFSQYSKLDFEVDEDLVLQQTDASKRNMINGYDEGTTSESAFIFFCYDPLLYKQALLHNGKVDDWDRTAVLICNLLRENENPKAMREAIKEKLITKLDKRRSEFLNILQKLSECNTDENLYD
jgi:hypothetical protein